MNRLHALRAAFSVAAGSAIAGAVIVLHDIYVAYRFSTTKSSDAYLLAISFPSLAINVFSGGVLLAVLVPRLSSIFATGQLGQVNRLVAQTRKMMLSILLLVSACWLLFYPLIIELAVSDTSLEAKRLGTHLLWLVMPALLFSGLAGIGAAILNSQQRFLLNSLTPAFMPGCALMAGVVWAEAIGVYALAIGYMVGAIIHWIAVGLSVRGLGMRNSDSPDIRYKDDGLRGDYAMMVLATGMLALIHLADIVMAAFQEVGGVSVYTYATRPVLLLSAFATVVIGNVTLSYFSRHVAESNWRALTQDALIWLGITFGGTLIVVSFWHVYVDEIVTLIYQRGAFTAEQSLQVSGVQSVYMLQMPVYLMGVLALRVLNSMGAYRVLVVAAAAALLINFVSSWLFMQYWGLIGVAWGTNLAFGVWAVVISYSAVAKVRDLLSTK